MTQYAKMLLAVLVTVLTALVPMLALGHLSTANLLNVALIGVGALFVFAAPNVPGAQYTKFVLAILAAGLTALVTFVGAAGTVQGVTPSQWIQVVIAVAGAVGVFAIPNATPLPAGNPAMHR